MSEVDTPTAAERKARGPTKPYPPDTFADCLELARAIHQHGFDGSIRRVTVLQRMQRPIEGRATRNLITNSNKYGLISGGYSAEHLSLTEQGNAVIGDGTQRNRSA